MIKYFVVIAYFLWYFFKLLLDIISANIHVATIVLSKKIHIVPVTIYYETKIKSDTLKVVLANSITLTPGTLTVSMVNNKLQIHCLDQRFIIAPDDFIFEKILRKIEDVMTC